MGYKEIAWNDKRTIFSCVLNDFWFTCDLNWEAGVLKLKNKCSILNLFRGLGYFPQISGQVKEWIMLELHGMIRVTHIVACPVTHILLCGRGRLGAVLKLIKIDQFLVFLAGWFLFHKFLGRLRSALH